MAYIRVACGTPQKQSNSPPSSESVEQEGRRGGHSGKKLKIIFLSLSKLERASAAKSEGCGPVLAMLAGAAAAAAHDESHEFPTYGTLEHERMVRDSQTASPTRVVVHSSWCFIQNPIQKFKMRDHPCCHRTAAPPLDTHPTIPPPDCLAARVRTPHVALP